MYVKIAQIHNSNQLIKYFQVPSQHGQPEMLWIKCDCAI